MTHDLVAFLRARLDEDEALATRTPGPAWEHRQITANLPDTPVLEDYIAVADPDRNTVVLSDVDLDVLHFVLANDPAHALAQIATKRAIIDEYEEAVRYYATNLDAPAGEAHGLRTALRLLATPYAGHPDYRSEWTQ